MIDKYVSFLWSFTVPYFEHGIVLYVGLGLFLLAAIFCSVAAGYNDEGDKLLDNELWTALAVLSAVIAGFILPIILPLFLMIAPLAAISLPIIACYHLGKLINKLLKPERERRARLRAIEQREAQMLEDYERQYARAHRDVRFHDEEMNVVNDFKGE